MKLPQGTHAELVSSMLGATTMNLLLTDGNSFLTPGDSLKGGPHMGALEQASSMISWNASLPEPSFLPASIMAVAVQIMFSLPAPG